MLSPMSLILKSFNTIVEKAALCVKVSSSFSVTGSLAAANCLSILSISAWVVTTTGSFSRVLRLDTIGAAPSVTAPGIALANPRLRGIVTSPIG